MKIDDHLYTHLPRPADRFVHVRRRTTGIWAVRVVVRPVSDGYPYNIEACTRDLLEVCQLHPAIPMRLEDIVVCCLVTKLLAKGVLVDDTLRAVVLLEDRGSDPGLED